MSDLPGKNKLCRKNRSSERRHQGAPVPLSMSDSNPGEVSERSYAGGKRVFVRQDDSAVAGKY